MRGDDEAGPAGTLVPRVPPLLGEVFHILARRIERPGMVAEPRIGIAEPGLGDGIWVEIQAMKGLTYKIFIDLALLPP